jgi:hypothetical protein
MEDDVMTISPKMVFIGALLLGIGGWLITLDTWLAASTPVAIGGLFMILGSILAPALSKGSIITPKE